LLFAVFEVAAVVDVVAPAGVALAVAVVPEAVLAPAGEELAAGGAAEEAAEGSGSARTDETLGTVTPTLPQA